MTSSIKNSKTSQNRLESFHDALEGLVRQYASATESQDRADSADLFAYGFGFGNPLTQLLGKHGPAVRDLFLLSDITSSTVDVVQLAKEWPRYKSHVEGLATEMFGSTPMREGLSTIQQRFQSEAGREHSERILFLLSDGEPTDSRPDEIVRIADELKRDGIFVVSCFVTSEDLAEARHIYGRAPSHWPAGARLMFDCSSVVPEGSPFLFYLKEHRWKVDDGGRLFTQLNQSELLAEFMNVVLSPFTGDARIGAESGNSKHVELSTVVNSRTSSGQSSDATASSATHETRTAEAAPDLLAKETPLASRLHNPSGDESKMERTNWPAWAFGGLLVLFFMSIVWFKPQVVFRPTQDKLLRILASVLVGVISGFFAGTLRLEGKIPVLKDMQIGAIGGFAGFALTFFLW
jgi:hypothetical protein